MTRFITDLWLRQVGFLPHYVTSPRRRVTPVTHRRRGNTVTLLFRVITVKREPVKMVFLFSLGGTENDPEWLSVTSGKTLKPTLGTPSTTRANSKRFQESNFCATRRR